MFMPVKKKTIAISIIRTHANTLFHVHYLSCLSSYLASPIILHYLAELCCLSEDFLDRMDLAVIIIVNGSWNCILYHMLNEQYEKK